MSTHPKDYLLEILEDDEDRKTEAKREVNKVDEIMAKFGVEGVGSDASQSLSEENLYGRHATR